jgi:hypothetical protein
LLDSIKANEACLKSAIWSPKIADNKEIKKKPERLNNLKHLLCEDNDFWIRLTLIEELLRPLKTAILAIEGSVVDVYKAFKLVDFSFDQASEVASKFPDKQKNRIEEVSI